MFPKPRQDLVPNTAEFERLPFVKATGFREYDARWRYPDEINLLGLEAVGLGLATLMRARGVPVRVVVGHDYRSYSAAIKEALMTGLLAGGAEVHDIGLALSPTAYFAQFALEVEGVAMVTATRDAVLEHKADLGLAFDGDGDRCGVVDNEGEAIFADKVGVMLARDIAARNKGALFVADVKSTGLFLTDPVLKQHGAKTLYWKTGHSYIQGYSHETGARVGFEKSGHFF